MCELQAMRAEKEILHFLYNSGQGHLGKKVGYVMFCTKEVYLEFYVSVWDFSTGGKRGKKKTLISKSRMPDYTRTYDLEFPRCRSAL